MEARKRRRGYGECLEEKPVTENRKLFGLDEKINLAGRLTSIREQHQKNKVRTMRGNCGAVLGKDPFGHWAVIQKDDESTEQFDISEADFRYLRGEA
jgi:hypothetical protein